MITAIISINKPHTDDIFSEKKGLEWRKKALPEGLYYVYETKNKGGCGMVIGEMCIVGSRAVDTSGPLEVSLVNAGCVHPVSLKKYANNGIIYANFIMEAKRYDEPKPLDEFFHACDKQKGTDCSVCIERKGNKCKTVTRPPQSWCYVEKQIIEMQPTVEEVVRCKDCKNLEITGCYGECKRGYMGIVKPWDFCSYGERKDNG